MSFLIDNCCLKLNSFICGSNESSMEKKKKKKIQIQPQILPNNTSSNKKVINRTEPTPISSYHQHYVNVTPQHHHIIQQQNSLPKYSYYENLPQKHYSRESSLNSYSERRLSRQSSSFLTNGVILKDIILRRKSPSERLGLTLCYGITSKSTTNIYIQQIDKESIAYNQGELRNGDQIIKINNHRVTSRDEAINLINGACRIHLQIIRFELSGETQSIVPLTEDDSGVVGDQISKFSNKSCISLSMTALNHCTNCRRMQTYSNQFQYRRCLSLNDLRPCLFLTQSPSSTTVTLKPFIRSQSLFGTTTDNEQFILKPLPYYTQSMERQRDDSDSGLVCNRSRSNDSYANQLTLKRFRRRCREQRLKEQQYITTDDEPMSELKQGKYWTRQQRKEHLAKAKQYRQRAKFFQQQQSPCTESAAEDFNLLNRIFLRENQYELQQKPLLAYRYDQQSSIERNRLKRMIQQHYFNRMKSQSTTTVSISSTIDQPTMIIL